MAQPRGNVAEPSAGRDGRDVDRSGLGNVVKTLGTWTDAAHARPGGTARLGDDRQVAAGDRGTPGGAAVWTHVCVRWWMPRHR